MQLSDLNAFGQWMESIEFDPVSQMFTGKFLPEKTVNKKDFKQIALALRTHVVDEILKMICDVLEVDFETTKTKTRVRKYVFARYVAIYILLRRFDVTLECIASGIGFTTHANIYNSIKRLQSNPDVKEKIRKVYRAYPMLYKRENNND